MERITLYRSEDGTDFACRRSAQQYEQKCWRKECVETWLLRNLGARTAGEQTPLQRIVETISGHPRAFAQALSLRAATRARRASKPAGKTRADSCKL